MLTIDEAIAHAKEVASKNRILAESNDLVRNSYSVGLKEKQCLLCAEEHEQLAEWLEELKGYKRLEEQGLLLKLPCKVGDTIFFLCRYHYGEYFAKIYGEILPVIVNDIAIVNPYWKINGDEHEFTPSDICKTVFLTKSEAEEALRRMEGRRL